MAKKKIEYKFIVDKLYERQHLTLDEQCVILTGMTTKEFTLALIENPGGKYDKFFKQDENLKAEQKKRRARERRAAGGW